MKIKIFSDVHDVVERIKDIDEGYFIVFDTIKNSYELHNSNQPISYCLTIPYSNIDSRVIDLIYSTNIQYIDNIIEDVDKNNENIEKQSINAIKDVSDYKLREIYKFANNSSKNLDSEGLFNNSWR